MESKLTSHPKLLKRYKEDHSIYLGWFYFPNYSFPMLTNVHYVGKKTFKNLGTYHTFRLVAYEDKELVETVIVKKHNKTDLVYMYELGMSTIYSFSKSKTLTTLQSKKSNLRIQKNSIEKEIKHLEKLEQAILEDDSEKAVKTCLLIVHGTCANAVFVTSVVQGLKIEQGFHRVDVLLGYPYMKQCLSMHPCIDKIWVSDPYTLTPKTSELYLRTIFPFDESYYDRVVDMKPVKSKNLYNTYMEKFNLTKKVYDIGTHVPSDFINYALSRTQGVKIGYANNICIDELKEKFPQFIFVEFDTFDDLYQGEYDFSKVMSFNLALGKLSTMDYVIGELCDMLLVASTLGRKTITIKSESNSYIERYGKENVPNKFFPNNGHLIVNNIKKLEELFATIEIPS